MQIRELNWSDSESYQCLQAITPFGYYEIMNRSTAFLAGEDVQTAFTGVTIHPPMTDTKDVAIFPYRPDVESAKEMCMKHHTIMMEVHLFDQTY